MNNITLITDTSSDLDASIIQEYGITEVPFYVSFNQVDYVKEKVEISIEDFYKRMRSEKVFPKTSLPSINDYYEVFSKMIAEGKDIICVCLSGHFSGSYNSAVNARELILENHPNHNIAIINSLNATGGQGLLVTEIARMIKDGIAFDKILEIAPLLIKEARIFFFVDTLEYLENGGRIGKASALLGTMLNVKPVIYLQDGVLHPTAKVRGRKKAISKIIELALSHTNNDLKNYRYIIGHADNLSYAEEIGEIFTELTKSPAPSPYFTIGTTIGVYTGYDACGICVIPKYETLLNA